MCLRSKQSRTLCKRSLKEHQTNATSENRSHFQNMSQLGKRSCFRSRPDITSAAMFYSPQTMQNGSGQHFVSVCTTWILRFGRKYSCHLHRVECVPPLLQNSLLASLLCMNELLEIQPQNSETCTDPDPQNLS